MARAFVAIGSNVEPAVNFRQALHLLAKKASVRRLSTVYRSKALGRGPQPDFWNAVTEVITHFPPLEFKQEILHGIERRLGRERTHDKWAPRTIDLDLLLFGDLMLIADGLRVPSPEIMTRPFVAIPLLELDPGLVLPDGVELYEVVQSLSPWPMQALPEITAQLKKDLEP